MCGIVGIIGQEPAAPRLLEALKRLEYRGYDSAGLATIVNGHIERRRAPGKLAALAEAVAAEPLPGTTGIGHTRWATHGAPTEANAHPHATERVALVHNGIIENFAELRAELSAAGYRFTSQTDTETVAVLITQLIDQGLEPVAASQAAMKRLRGAFALAVVFAGRKDLLVGLRRGSPMAVGFGDGEMFLGSDAMALAPLTRRIAYLEEGDCVVLDSNGATFFDESDHTVARKVSTTAASGALVGKGNYRHFMQKEIFEHPTVIGDTLHQLVDPARGAVTLPDLPFDLASLSRVTLIACGTSYYAAQVARGWIEKLARIPVETDIASEFRYRDPVLAPGGLCVFVSQSGETADTLAALRLSKALGQRTLGIVNVPESSIAREAEAMIQTVAGPEIGVASTKAMSAQLTVLACLALALARARGTLDAQGERRLTAALTAVPAAAAEVLDTEAAVRRIAADIFEARTVLYLGRGQSWPVAMEGALKLKEISYIHAEGYAAGEMKHGPIALIDERVPVIAIAPSDAHFEKTVSNLQEAAARGAKVIAVTDPKGARQLEGLAHDCLVMPAVDAFVAPILAVIPVHMLAYHVAVLRGTDVDQPRNLAKSVTVE
ncbi:MAG: glutamine--fructose-6-phosphate transaminase (isomerizing) [Acetobacteraceae bacterium]|nr:glutamine--fructose-6-phosphate transaminase (isomerizing) [Acetobacteraceae bacterium]